MELPVIGETSRVTSAKLSVLFNSKILPLSVAPDTYMSWLLFAISSRIIVLIPLSTMVLSAPIIVLLVAPVIILIGIVDAFTIE